MRTSEKERLLKSSGFYPLRQAKHGWLWTDGISRIQVAGSPGDNWRGPTQFKSDIKKALKKREEK